MAGKLRVGEDKVYNFDIHTQWDALVGHAVSYVWQVFENVDLGKGLNYRFRFRGLWCKEVDEVINRMKSYREISRLQENKNGREKEAELYCFYQNLLWSRVK